MLEEAVTIIRRMFTGELVTHHGNHYDVDTARLYTLPDDLPPIYMSGFGTKAAELAGRIADGFICVKPRTRCAHHRREQDRVRLATDAAGAPCCSPSASGYTEPPTPCTPRQTIRNGMSGASAPAIDAKAKTPSPTGSSRRRP
jgi:hypothetical protein